MYEKLRLAPLIIFCFSQVGKPFSELHWCLDSYPCKTLHELLSVSWTQIKFCLDLNQLIVETPLLIG